MIIRGTPNNKDDYICVTPLVSEVLHMCNFYPKYIDDKYIYYTKSICIEKFMEREGLVALDNR